MPRKRSAIRPKVTGVICDFDDEVPNSLIEFIQALPTSSETKLSSPEPPNKRLKVDTFPDSCRMVAEGQLLFSRHCSESSQDYLIGRRNVGTHLSFALRDNEGLVIKSRKTAKQGSVSVQFAIRPEELTENVSRILQIGGSSLPTQAPGVIWTCVDIEMEKYDMDISVALHLQLVWNETPSPVNGLRTQQHREDSRNLIDWLYPCSSESEHHVAASSPMDFYEAAHVPCTEDSSAFSIETPSLDATLFPYQKRTVQWMLRREGVTWSAQSGLVKLDEDRPAPVTQSSREVQDANGKSIFLNEVFHTISSNLLHFNKLESSVKGGILAEEMGLGKTLEALALILLHSRTEIDATTEIGADSTLLQSGATLIVTPESLRQQWLSEISRHAPGLRCEFYQGCKRETGEGDEVAKKLASCDIVITTYGILSAELHFANEAPERSRRQERRYERPKSPLIQISWWRLCLDEAQMIESGFSQAAQVARVIPRVNAWGITGTPVKDNVQDLYGLLMFLRYEPLCSSPQVWRAVLERKPIFQKLFKTLALRHTKALVRDEISLPPQRRFAISIPFTAVEEQHYQNIFKEMTTACGVDLRGNPMIEGWDPEDYVEEMRTWLNRLRQTALHPQIGSYGRQLLRPTKKSSPMRTVDEVLAAMIEQAESSVKADHRAFLTAKLLRGQLLENGPRVKEALEVWEEVRRDTEALVAAARQDISEAFPETAIDKSTSIENKSKDDDSFGINDELEDSESKDQIAEYRRRLRSALEMQHKAVFFCACAFFQIGSNQEMTVPDSDEHQELKEKENSMYEEAKTIRQQILLEPRQKVDSLMKEISQKAKTQKFVQIPELVAPGNTGIESNGIIETLNVLYSELNEQANKLDLWRESVIQILLKPLVDEDDDIETTGEELLDATRIQDELMIRVQVLRSAIADRQEALTGQINELVKHETQTSIRLAKNNEGPAPEKLLRLMEARAKIKPRLASTSMRGSISHFRSIIGKLNGEVNQTQRVMLERTIASRALAATQEALTAQNKAMTLLESELELFTTTMNSRLEYYRRLQGVSDGVQAYDGPKGDCYVERCIRIERDLSCKLSTEQAKLRYLLHLRTTGSRSNEARLCVICQTNFETGVLTVCGHHFCKECMMLWFKAHRNCPVCKTHLSSSELHDITIKPQELKVLSDGNEAEAESDQGPIKDQERKQEQNGLARKSAIYSAFSSEQLAEIENVELDGPSYTTKVDTLIRHLIWLRETDPGAKSIVFSQYKDFLDILATAFKRFQIGFTSIDSHGSTAKFKSDPAIEVFLLHARAHSSGLNLVNASHVFLCEPLVNTAIELQAIARVDRIGQQRATTVWLYVTSGTVEEAVYNLSVKRRMEHIRRGGGGGGGVQESARNGKDDELHDATLDAANTLELEHAALSKLMSKDRTAGEAVDKGDLWECLFGHVAQEQRVAGGNVVDLTED